MSLSSSVVAARRGSEARLRAIGGRRSAEEELTVKSRRSALGFRLRISSSVAKLVGKGGG